MDRGNTKQETPESSLDRMERLLELLVLTMKK